MLRVCESPDLVSIVLGNRFYCGAGSNALRGKVSQLRVWNTARSAADIQKTMFDDLELESSKATSSASAAAPAASTSSAAAAPSPLEAQKKHGLVACWPLTGHTHELVSNLRTTAAFQNRSLKFARMPVLDALRAAAAVKK